MAGKSQDDKDENSPGDAVVGLDIGPSTLAAVDDEGARLERFCDELKGKHRQDRTGVRQLDRRRRATNPSNDNEDGTIEKGPKRWVRSRRYRGRLAKLGALASWPSAGLLLSRAGSSFSRAASRGGACRPPLAFWAGQSGSSAEDGIRDAEARAVVAVGLPIRESPSEAEVLPVRTPWLEPWGGAARLRVPWRQTDPGERHDDEA
jgi:hypothetical protein